MTLMEAAPQPSDDATPELSPPVAERVRDDIEPVANERLDRSIVAFITILPFLGLGVACWQGWSSLLRWSDVGGFAVVSLICGLGVTVGFHRHFTHRSFSTSTPLRAALAIAGSAAIEGPVISWVADHRKHH